MVSGQCRKGPPPSADLRNRFVAFARRCFGRDEATPPDPGPKQYLLSSLRPDGGSPEAWNLAMPRTRWDQHSPNLVGRSRAVRHGAPQAPSRLPRPAPHRDRGVVGGLQRPCTVRCGRGVALMKHSPLPSSRARAARSAPSPCRPGPFRDVYSSGSISTDASFLPLSDRCRAVRQAWLRSSAHTGGRAGHGVYGRWFRRDLMLGPFTCPGLSTAVGEPERLVGAGAAVPAAGDVVSIPI